MREAVTRLRAGDGGTDRHHNPVQDWDDPDELEIPDCSVAPRYSDEERGQGREGVVIGLTVYVRRTVDVVATDRIVARGDTWQVDGDPADWRSPHTNRRGMQIQLRRVEG